MSDLIDRRFLLITALFLTSCVGYAHERLSAVPEKFIIDRIIGEAEVPDGGDGHFYINTFNVLPSYQFTAFVVKLDPGRSKILSFKISKEMIGDDECGDFLSEFIKKNYDLGLGEINVAGHGATTSLFGRMYALEAKCSGWGGIGKNIFQFFAHPQ